MSTATRSNSTASGEQLRIELALEGEDGERWRVRVGLRPSQRSVHIDGATVALCDQDGRLLGPAVVLPVVGEISDEVELYTGVQGPHPLRAGSALRCTVFFSSGQQPQEHEVVVVQRRGFSAWLRGESVQEPPMPVEGRALTDGELLAMREAWPQLFPPDGAGDEAFDIFKEDLLDSMEGDEHDSVTEEILRMLKED